MRSADKRRYCAIAVLLAWGSAVIGQEGEGKKASQEERIRRLEQRVIALEAKEWRISHLEGLLKSQEVEARAAQERLTWLWLPFGIMCGAFCALWAQDTRRNAWGWFFVGVLMNLLPVLYVLYLNAQDRWRAKTRTGCDQMPSVPTLPPNQ